MDKSPTRKQPADRKLRQLEDNLKALREEARGGYGKDEVRRNCIKADLVAQRESRERAAAEAASQARRQQMDSEKVEARRVHSSPSRPRTSTTGVGTESSALPGCGTDMGSNGSDGGGGISFLDALWLAESGAESIGTRGEEEPGNDAVAAKVVSRAAALQASLYPELRQLTADYSFDADAAERLGAVQEWDAQSGLPLVWVTAGARHGPGSSYAADVAPSLTGGDLLESMLAATVATTSAATVHLAGAAEQQQRTLPDTAPRIAASSPSHALLPRPPTQPRLNKARQPRGGSSPVDASDGAAANRPPATGAQHNMRVAGHRSLSRPPSSSRSTLSVASATATAASRPHAQRTTKGLSSMGTAVAVNYAESFTSSLRAQVTRERQQQQQQKQQADLGVSEEQVSGGTAASRLGQRHITIIREYEEHRGHDEDDGGQGSRVRSRVTRPLTLLFCTACRASVPCDLAEYISSKGAAIGTKTVVCEGCGAAVDVPSAAEGLVPHRRQHFLDDEEGDDARQPPLHHRVDDEGGTGTDAVNFPPSEEEMREKANGGSDGDNSFAAAVAAVRRAIAADRAAATTDRTPPQPKEEARRAAVGTGPDAPSTGLSGSAAWEQVLCGVYFAHLWDEAHRSL